MKKPAAKAKQVTQNDNRVGIQIGCGDFAKVGDYILQILGAPHADEATKVAALQAFEKTAKVENVSISDVTLTNS